MIKLRLFGREIELSWDAPVLLSFVTLCVIVLLIESLSTTAEFLFSAG